MKISVIVPVYNTRDCLKRCVDSILNQTYQNLEVLLVDDGSTDGSGQLCDAFVKQDNRVRVYHKENGGASSARNLGMQNAIGDYISFIDSDDYIDSDVYQMMIELIQEKDLPIVQISRDERDEAGGRLEDVCIPPKEVRLCDTETFIKELLLHQADCSFCTKLVKREPLLKHRFPEGELNEDFKLLVELFVQEQEIKEVGILPKQGYHVICRSDSTTRKRSEDSFSRVFMDIVNNADHMQQVVDQNYPKLRAYALRFNLYQRLDYMLHIPISQMNRQNAFYQEVKKYLRRHVLHTIFNPYLTIKNKEYLLLLTVAPKTVRKVHKRKMERRDLDE
ncbi:MAG: glycosyltransferase family 2 protein [Lachnospiraceae bacterium]|nr:glycosyltransferase family 2 protein [Lachnospiraceae bacterium]